MPDLNNSSSKSGWTLLKENIHFVKYLKPMIYLLVFSVLYGGLYLLTTNWQINTLFKQLVQGLLVSCYGVAWYFVMGLIWGRKKGTLSGKSVLLVLAWCFVWGVLGGALLPYLSFLVLNNFIGRLIIQILAAVGLMVFVPATILFFRGVYKGESRLPVLFNQIKLSMIARPSAVFNPWLILLLLALFWDSMFNGPLTIYYGFNAPVLFANLLYLSYPMVYPLMLVVSGWNYMASLSEMITLLSLSSLVCVWLSVNMCAWIGSTWIAPEPASLRHTSKGRKAR